MSRPPRLALVTSSAGPDLTADDALLVVPLRRLGYEVAAAPWDRPDVDWSNFDCCVVRSVWNYPALLPEFLAWLDRIEGLPPRLWNPLPALRWNLYKTYLGDLERAGFPVIPTVFVEPGAPLHLGDVLRSRGWEEAVVKPGVGIGGFQTSRVRRADAEEAEASLAASLGTTGALVQPYLPEVVRCGEVSLIVFGTEFSHAVLKRPSPGEFRVQFHYGGSAAVHAADPASIALARKIVGWVREPLLYARIDGIPVRGSLLIAEVELIDPVLYLGLAPEAPERFAGALRLLSPP